MINMLILEEEDILSDYMVKTYPDAIINKNLEEYNLTIVDSDLKYYPFEIKTECLLISEDINIESAPIFVKQIISCGMNEKNTVCFSSIDDQIANLCIRRSFETKSGKIIFPCEIRCKYNTHLSPIENIIENVTHLYLD